LRKIFGPVCIDLQISSSPLNSGDWNGLGMYTGCRVPEFQKTYGRENIRWKTSGEATQDAVCQDAREQLGVKRWRREAEDRMSWRYLIEAARVHFGI
jgi:hypothetical protein